MRNCFLESDLIDVVATKEATLKKIYRNFPEWVQRVVFAGQREPSLGQAVHIRVSDSLTYQVEDIRMKGSFPESRQ